ncbi:MAG TPA: hypothetical protein VMW43_04985 [Bacteroidota bacterium]|nr:hypothetical protein [Bacteroidota bacterium]
MKPIMKLLAPIIILLCSPHINAQNPDSLAPVLRLFDAGESRIYLLGTVHGAHARNHIFTWPHLERVLSVLRPDMLLVEIRPEHFRPEEFYSDGPPEMTYLVFLASHKGIRCRGIDWWPDDWLFNIASLTGDDFEHREDSMMANIAGETARAKLHTVLVTTGAGHIDGFVRRFTARGWKELPCPPFDLAVSGYPDLPSEVIQMWEQGAEYLTKTRIGSTDRIRQKVETLRAMAREGGYEFVREKK